MAQVEQKQRRPGTTGGAKVQEAGLTLALAFALHHDVAVQGAGHGRRQLRPLQQRRHLDCSRSGPARPLRRSRCFRFRRRSLTSQCRANWLWGGCEFQKEAATPPSTAAARVPQHHPGPASFSCPTPRPFLPQLSPAAGSASPGPAPSAVSYLIPSPQPGTTPPHSDPAPFPYLLPSTSPDLSSAPFDFSTGPAPSPSRHSG